MNMKDVLDKLIDATTDDSGAAGVQIQIGGGTYAGALKRCDDYDGLYELMTIGQKQGAMGQPVPFPVRIVFDSAACEAVFIPHEDEDAVSSLVVPSGNNLPGIQ